MLSSNVYITAWQTHCCGIQYEARKWSCYWISQTKYNMKSEKGTPVTRSDMCAGTRCLMTIKARPPLGSSLRLTKTSLTSEVIVYLKNEYALRSVTPPVYIYEKSLSQQILRCTRSWSLVLRKGKKHSTSCQHGHTWAHWQVQAGKNSSQPSF